MPTELLCTIGAALGLFAAWLYVRACRQRRKFMAEYDRIEREQKGGA